MTPRTSTGETPFRMAYDTEAVLLVEVSLGSSRIKAFDSKSSSEGLHLNNDLIEEVRDEAKIASMEYQNKTAKYFDKRVKTKTF